MWNNCAVQLLSGRTHSTLVVSTSRHCNSVCKYKNPPSSRGPRVHSVSMWPQPKCKNNEKIISKLSTKLYEVPHTRIPSPRAGPLRGAESVRVPGRSELSAQRVSRGACGAVPGSTYSPRFRNLRLCFFALVFFWYIQRTLDAFSTPLYPHQTLSADPAA